MGVDFFQPISAKERIFCTDHFVCEIVLFFFFKKGSFELSFFDPVIERTSLSDILIDQIPRLKLAQSKKQDRQKKEQCQDLSFISTLFITLANRVGARKLLFDPGSLNDLIKKRASIG